MSYLYTEYGYWKKEMEQHAAYHYTECGLDNIYLLNGFGFVETPRGQAVSIRNMGGLHRAIGQMLVRDKKNLSGKEFRFLRHEVNMTQQDLAAVLHVDVQSIARWEKGRNKRPIDGPAQGLLRVIYERFIGGDPEIIEPLRRLAEIDEIFGDDSEELSFEETEGDWQPSMAA